MSAQKVDAAIRARIHALLDDAFGDRLQGVVLYGSEARGTADSDSDADLLVLLRGPMALGNDLKTIIDALYPLQLEVERPIHALPVEATVYAEGEFLLYRNARKEGILL
jgi:predicted nucleotidyltransferase